MLSSGVHHLEEIKEAGLEQPAVNQIEVWRSGHEPYQILMPLSCTAASLVPTAGNCGLLQK